ncbi:PIN domain-containing protein [Streptomyces europaeiscabiei]|uniref:PIN domain-containing protein n=1 Tax=Streptomyces europaeiscabiei TaxID=146819 RepID=UPI00131B60F3|nr:PIN domain-containing protein [Streptomyces europaeiscabiei]
MIILDTNQLESLKPPNGTVLRILSKLANATGNGLALPEMVMVEHLAHRRNKVVNLQDNLRKAVDAISAEVTDARFYNGTVDVDAVIDDYRSRLEVVIKEVIKTPEAAAREALIREAERRAPAETRWDSKPGRGGRDVAIWLTVVDSAARNRRENYYFVSEDRAFGGDSGLAPDLVRELKDYPSGEVRNLKYFPRVEGLLSHLAGEVAEFPGEPKISASRLVASAVAEAINNSDASNAFGNAAGSVAPKARMYQYSIPTPQAVELLRVEKPSAYRMQGVGWAAFKAVWKLSTEVELEARNGDEFVFEGLVSVTGPFETMIVCELDAMQNITSAEVTEVRVFRGATLSVSVVE